MPRDRPRSSPLRGGPPARSGGARSGARGVRAEAAEHGLGQDELAALTRDRERSPSRSVDVERAGALLAGPAGLTAQRNSFEARHGVAELAAAHPDGLEAEQVGRAVERFLARSDVVAIPDESGERYTTDGLLACERRIVLDAMRSQGSGTGAVPAKVIENALASLPTRLSDEQAAAVRDRNEREWGGCGRGAGWDGQDHGGGGAGGGLWARGLSGWTARSRRR